MLPELTYENTLWTLWFISVIVLLAAAAYAAFPSKAEEVQIRRMRYSAHATPKDGQ